MGTDINIFAEYNENGEWKTCHEWIQSEDAESNPYLCKAYEDLPEWRNYLLFGFLAGVKGNIDWFKPRGLPKNMAKETKEKVKYWEDSSHSHSYLFIHELEETIPDIKEQEMKEMLTNPEGDCGYYHLKNSVKGLINAINVLKGTSDKRIVFFFDS